MLALLSIVYSTAATISQQYECETQLQQVHVYTVHRQYQTYFNATFLSKVLERFCVFLIFTPQASNVYMNVFHVCVYHRQPRKSSDAIKISAWMRWFGLNYDKFRIEIGFKPCTHEAATCKWRFYGGPGATASTQKPAPQCCCPWPWDVLEDKFWVLGLGLEGQVLGLGLEG